MYMEPWIHNYRVLTCNYTRPKMTQLKLCHFRFGVIKYYWLKFVVYWWFHISCSSLTVLNTPCFLPYLFFVIVTVAFKFEISTLLWNLNWDYKTLRITFFKSWIKMKITWLSTLHERCNDLNRRHCHLKLRWKLS